MFHVKHIHVHTVHHCIQPAPGQLKLACLVVFGLEYTDANLCEKLYTDSCITTGRLCGAGVACLCLHKLFFFTCRFGDIFPKKDTIFDCDDESISHRIAEDVFANFIFGEKIAEAWVFLFSWMATPGIVSTLITS